MAQRVKRTGLIALKVGMTQIYDDSGQAVPITLLKADSNYVVDTKSQDKNGYYAVVLGFGEAKQRRVSKARIGICAKAGVKPVKHMKEFRVSPDALLKAGQKLSINHFIENQLVDIQGVSVGKGFAGGMKRWNFKGLEASHGVSVSHRSLGSTGQRQDPGKTFKGKKMGGHLGAETVTVQNMLVVLVDKELGLIGVNGAVPGKSGRYVYISDAVKVMVPGNAQYPAALEDTLEEIKETHATQDTSAGGLEISLLEQNSDDAEEANNKI